MLEEKEGMADEAINAKHVNSMIKKNPVCLLEEDNNQNLPLHLFCTKMKLDGHGILKNMLDSMSFERICSSNSLDETPLIIILNKHKRHLLKVFYLTLGEKIITNKIIKRFKIISGGNSRNENEFKNFMFLVDNSPKFYDAFITKTGTNIYAKIFLCNAGIHHKSFLKKHIFDEKGKNVFKTLLLIETKKGNPESTSFQFFFRQFENLISGYTYPQQKCVSNFFGVFRQIIKVLGYQQIVQNYNDLMLLIRWSCRAYTVITKLPPSSIWTWFTQGGNSTHVKFLTRTIYELLKKNKELYGNDRSDFCDAVDQIFKEEKAKTFQQQIIELRKSLKEVKTPFFKPKSKNFFEEEFNNYCILHDSNTIEAPKSNSFTTIFSSDIYSKHSTFSIIIKVLHEGRDGLMQFGVAEEIFVKKHGALYLVNKYNTGVHASNIKIKNDTVYRITIKDCSVFLKKNDQSGIGKKIITFKKMKSKFFQLGFGIYKCSKIFVNQVRKWSMSEHKYFSVMFKKKVMILMCLHYFDGSGLSMLPKDCLFEIFQYMNDG